jgi:hypothetical protein
LSLAVVAIATLVLVAINERIIGYETVVVGKRASIVHCLKKPL